MVTKIKSFDKQNLAMLRPEIDEALKTLGEKYGVSFSTGNARFSPQTSEFKLEVGIMGADGKADTKASSDWKQLAPLYNLPVDALNKTFNFEGRTFTILGLLPKSRRFPVLVRTSAGKDFKYSTDMVKAAIALAKG